jgi:hypothetical protein
MKLISLLALLLPAGLACAQSNPCSIALLSDSFAIGDTVLFEVKASADTPVEVAVYAPEKMLYLSKDRLREGTHTYRVLSEGAAAGVYTILLSGEGFREEKNFSLK